MSPRCAIERFIIPLLDTASIIGILESSNDRSAGSDSIEYEFCVSFLRSDHLSHSESSYMLLVLSSVIQLLTIPMEIGLRQSHLVSVCRSHNQVLDRQ